MSSFKCSFNHFIKLRDYTYSFLISEKYPLFDLGLEYNDYRNEEKVKSYVNNEIYKLYKLNVASVNLQYRYKQDVPAYKEYEENIESVDFKKYGILSLYDLIGLYNAYDCLNYQIELSYNSEFMDIIKKHIASKIIEKLSDEYSDYVNRWEYE